MSHPSRTALMTVLAAVLIALVPAAPSQAQATDDYQREARVVTNNKRDAHELTKFDRGDCVQKFARRQARKMANQDRMFHQDLGSVLSGCGLTSVGENVAYGYSTGKAAVAAWMKSPGHRANILNPGFRLMGIAVAVADDGTPYTAQVFGTK